MLRSLVAGAILLMPVGALAQDGVIETAQSLTDASAVAESAMKTVETLSKNAAEHMLVKDMLGTEVTGPGGNVVGTVENLVVVPGGKVMAVIIKPKDGQPVALPYGALKVSTAASAANSIGLTLPISLDDLRGKEAVQKLTSTVLNSGS